jgi:hypothetical protein
MQVEDQLELRVSGGAKWVSAPTALLLTNNGRDFEVSVDASNLAPGLHYAEVQGWDTSAEWRGPLFKVPCTVCKPHVLPTNDDGTSSLAQCVALSSSNVSSGHSICFYLSHWPCLCILIGCDLNLVQFLCMPLVCLGRSHNTW